MAKHPPPGRRVFIFDASYLRGGVFYAEGFSEDCAELNAAVKFIPLAGVTFYSQTKEDWFSRQRLEFHSQFLHARPSAEAGRGDVLSVRDGTEPNVVPGRCQRGHRSDGFRGNGQGNSF